MIVHQTGIVSEALPFSLPLPTPSRDAGGRPYTVLVHTGQVSLRERLRSIAVSRGCECRVPATVGAAWRALAAELRLAFIDVAQPLASDGDEARAVAATLAEQPGVLLVVCGGPGDTPPAGDPEQDDERWARQLGAFVYLPEAGTDAGLALIVDEARQISRGIRGAGGREIARPRTVG